MRPDAQCSPRAPLTLSERLGHAWRTRSLASATASIIDLLGRTAGGPEWTRRAPWYFGYFGKLVRTDGLVIETPNRYMAGVLRLGGLSIYERYAVMAYLPPDLPVVELGAGLGFVSCLANRRLAKPERHVCVEANPAVLPLLRRNRDRNRCRFTIRHGALAYDAPEVQLGVDDNVSGSSIGDETKTLVTVPTTCLADVLREEGLDHVSVICDIEGTEQALFAREGVLFRDRVQTLILEVHPHLYGTSGVEELEAASRALGFQRVWSKANVWVLDNYGTPSQTR